jgi:Zn-dependent peptidase ImmA (M78 family)
MERLADRYAATLTMPAADVARLLKEFSDSGDKADVMAARFGVSEAAMRWRIQELAPARHGLSIEFGAVSRTRSGISESARHGSEYVTV